MGEYADTIMINLNFIGDIWILSDYLNVTISKHNVKKEKEQEKCNYWCEIYLNTCWIVKI